VETDEILFAGASSRPARTMCPVCGRDVPMISPEQAARIARVSTRTIYAWLEAGKVHFLDTPEASLLICMDSLTELRAGSSR